MTNQFHEGPHRRRGAQDHARFRRPSSDPSAEPETYEAWDTAAYGEIQPSDAIGIGTEWDSEVPADNLYDSEDEPAQDEESFLPLEESYASPEPEIIASNRLIRLTCTLAAMLSPFALFLLFAEKESHAVRYFSLQSVILAALHLLLALLMGILGSALGSLPYLGVMISALCWLIYLCGLIACLWQRVRLMLGAWQGYRVSLPLVGPLAARLGNTEDAL